jgi:hypothetical protein
MTAFSSDVYKATQEQPADTELDPYSDYLKKRSKAAQKWEGSATAYQPTTSLGEDLAAEDTYKAGEYKRRTGAAEQEMGLAKAEDTRSASVADRVKQALYDRGQTEQNITSKDLQQNRSAAQGTAGQLQQYGQATRQQDFTAYTNAADRYDAIKAANDKGILEYQILQANRNGALTIADLDRYFAVQKNELENLFKDVKATSDFDIEAFKAEILASAQNTGTVIEGLFSGLAAWISS